MAADYMTETQGDKIIALLTKILKELEDANSELRGISHAQQGTNKRLDRIETVLENKT